MSIVLLQRVAQPSAPPTQAAPRLDAWPVPACMPCHLWHLCPNRAAAVPPSVGVEPLVFARRRLLSGEVLCSAGEGFHFLFGVCGGSLKAVVALPDGREQVTNFLLAGDLVGLDAIASGQHTRTVTAIEDTRVCAISYRNNTNTSSSHQQAPQRALTRQLSLEITRTHRMMLLLGCLNAQERLAAFLLDLSHRTRCEGLPACELTLRMSRAEIGSFLGLTLETVSRTLSLFQQQGLLTVNHRHIRLLDRDGLAARFKAVLQG